MSEQGVRSPFAALHRFLFTVFQRATRGAFCGSNIDRAVDFKKVIPSGPCPLNEGELTFASCSTSY